MPRENLTARLRWAASLAVSVVAAGTSVALPGTASAAPATATCTASPTGTMTCSYGFTGTPETFTVPAGVTTLTVTAIGAAGGASTTAGGTAPGGRGDQVTGDIASTPGSTLTVVVGGPGLLGQLNPPDFSMPGGYNGGGYTRGSNAGASGGSGGGASDVRTVAGDLTSRVVVAGGGGGAGSADTNAEPTAVGVAGGDAGAPGLVGLCTYPVAAQPGAAAAGGAGGQCGENGRTGGLGAGGATGTVSFGVAGGGGGGGRYGGGAGGSSSTFSLAHYLGGSGAGGSSLVPAGGSHQLTSAPAGVTISYLIPQTPAAPAAVRSVPGDGSAVVEWDAGAVTATAGAATSYTATTTPGGASCTTTGTSCSITGLVNGTTYATSVTASNAFGTSPATSGPDAVPFGAPGAPGAVTVTPTASGLAIAFTPAAANGRPVTGYRATITDLATGTVSAVEGPASPLQATGLSPGARYGVTVVALTGSGSGSPTPSAVGVVPAAADPVFRTADDVRTATPTLAVTGTPVGTMAATALGLVGAGVALVVAGRRRATR